MTGVAVLQYGNLRIDSNQRRVYVNEQVCGVDYNGTFLYYLALHPGWTFYPGAAFTNMRCLMTFASGLESVTRRIYKIRKKLNINAIQTVHGYGYRFEK